VVVVCGEALVDLVPHRSSEAPAAAHANSASGPDGSLSASASWLALPGGSPANVAVGLARLGQPATLLARLADDSFGRLLRDHLSRAGVDLTLALPSAEPTTLAVVALDPSGVADYAFYVEGAADGGWHPDQLPAELPAAAAAVMASGSLALAVPDFDETVVALLTRERGRRAVVVDPNVRLSLIRDRADHLQRLHRWISLADLVKVSDADLHSLEPGVDPITVAQAWRERGPAVVVVTKGAEGAVAVTSTDVIAVPGLAVDVADTVGAGDAFSAGLLTALAERGQLSPAGLTSLTRPDLEQVLTFATSVAALTCTRPGADPPTRAELDRLGTDQVSTRNRVM